MSIHYALTPSRPEAHIYTVVLTISGACDKGLQLSLPAWIPGSYMIRDFARNVISITAQSGDTSIALEKIDKSTWAVTAGCSELVVTYEIYAWDLSVRAAHLDTTHGFFNGTSVFLAVEGRTEQPCTVELLPPGSALCQHWQVATSLLAKNTDANGFGSYHADSYDELIDHPVEMGTFERVTFEACGVPHELVLTGRFKTDLSRICADLKVICEHQIRMFGEPPPVDRYVFLVMVVGEGYGGLEHRASTALLIRRENLPVPDEDTISDAYLEFLGLCSHEYFHTWNVKRIKPARFIPYQLAEESYTELLWAFEGITSYYDDLVLVRCGLIDAKRYLKLLAQTITRVYRGSGRLRQSVAASSFDAWTKFYKQDENAPNAIVSYYAKGALVALSLDALIRQCTGGNKSLDNLMRVLWQQWLASREGVTQSSIEHEVAQLCGAPQDAFFKQAVFGTDDLPLRETLAALGVVLKWRVPESESDRGGTPALETAPSVTLSVRTAPAPGGLRITHVFDNGAAQMAGIAAGDVLVAVAGLAVNSTSLPKTLARYQAGDVVECFVFRHDELQRYSVSLQAPLADTCHLQLGDAKLAVSWLHLDDLE